MNIRIDSNFNFLVTSIQYFPNGELFISLTSEENQSENRYQYEAASLRTDINMRLLSAAGKPRRNRPSACCNGNKCKGKSAMMIDGVVIIFVKFFYFVEKIVYFCDKI